MESFHDLTIAHWDHELDRPRRRPRKTSRPVEDEDEGTVHGKRSLPGSWKEFHEIFALWTLNR